jgi:serine/threonine protein kinase
LQSKLLLVYELMDEDLNSYINNTTKRKEIPTLFQRLKVASQVASGLSWVASKGVVHGDLKQVPFLLVCLLLIFFN